MAHASGHVANRWAWKSRAFPVLPHDPYMKPFIHLPTHYRHFHRIAWLATLMTLFTLGFGAFVRLSDAGLIWEGHKAGRDIGYCHLEKLHNLEALPPTGFFISCFPHKIRGASAGWTRAVAIFDDALMAAR